MMSNNTHSNDNIASSNANNKRTRSTNRRKSNKGRKNGQTKPTSASTSSSSMSLHQVCLTGTLLLSLAAPLTAAFEATHPATMMGRPALHSSRQHRIGTINSANAHNNIHNLNYDPRSSLMQLNFRDSSDGTISPSASPVGAPMTSSPVSHTSKAPSKAGGWWTSLFSTSAAVSSNEDTAAEDTAEQDAVDEYLEFLNRRYQRLHNVEEEEEEMNQQPFNVMQWIMNGQNRNAAPATARKQKDALYVLGVAGMASQKLLQKLLREQQQEEQTQAKQHALLQRQEEKQQMQLASSPLSGSAPTGLAEASALPTYAISLPSAIIDSDAAVVSTTHKMIKCILPALRAIYIVQHRRQETVRFVSHKAQLFASAALRKVVRSVANAPRATLLWGGGKKNMMLTVALTSTLFLLLGPLVRAFLADGQFLK